MWYITSVYDSSVDTYQASGDCTFAKSSDLDEVIIRDLSTGEVVTVYGDEIDEYDIYNYANNRIWFIDECERKGIGLIHKGEYFECCDYVSLNDSSVVVPVKKCLSVNHIPYYITCIRDDLYNYNGRYMHGALLACIILKELGGRVDINAYDWVSFVQLTSNGFVQDSIDMKIDDSFRRYYSKFLMLNGGRNVLH